ncbi:MAG: prolyl oligopeptidase family serine peptidase, partial [Pseudomonadota bacterium]
KVARAFPKLNNRIEDWTDNLGRVIVRTNGNGDSGSWFNVDLENLSASALGYERMAVTPEKVGKISTITYQAGDGLEIEAILTLPPGKDPTNLPLVVFPHGGPTGQDDAVFDWWAQAVAYRGYAVLQPNFRGSTNRDRAFIRAGYGEWGRKMQTDLSDGIAHLAAEGIVDPSRACIMGASYGGYAALAGVTLQQGIYRCAVSFAGVSDLTRLTRTEIRESGSNSMVKRVLKEEIGQGRELKDISPR